MHLELRAKQLSPSLFAECTMPCIAPICVMQHTLQRNAMWIAYTPLESLQIQEAGHRFVLHVLFVVTMHAVCLILKRYVCLQVLS